MEDVQQPVRRPAIAGEEWFDRALVEDWHTGTKLVPDDWPER